MSTQMLEARAGRITEEMERVALQEGVTPEYIRERVADSRIVIPKNTRRNCSKICGIGEGLDIKVNSLMGTSSDRNDKAMEKRKLRLIEEAGADAFMDLSTGDDIDGMRRQSIAASNITAGCVPVYQAANEAIEKHGSMVAMTSRDLLDVIEKECEDGMDFMAVHSAYNRQLFDILRKTGRLANIVSRGGSILTAWMHYNQKDNPLYAEFDKVLEILKSTDTVLSIGDAIRPGCNFDSLDAAQMAGLMVAGDLAKRAIEAGVQVMIEGPGHVPLNHIATTMQMQKRLCHNVPYYILGFLATDVAPGYDNITGAIGGAFAGMHGADFLCNLTPAEHLGLPTEEDVVTGVRTARIAADCANVLRRGGRAWNRSLAMAKARVNNDVQAQIDNALMPEVLRERLAREPKHDHCAACSDGLCPADVAYDYFFGDNA